MTKAERDRDYNRNRRDPALLKLYSTAPWRKFRDWIKAERAICEWCWERKGVAVSGDHVHHTVDPRKDPTALLDPDRVVLLCQACHSAHHGFGRR